jgi:hypothetical protein
MDRDVVRGMVEDYWRTIIPALQNSGAAASQEIGTRFEQRIAETAALLPPIESAAFIQTVDAERERMMAEYKADPVALKQRLGVSLGIDGPSHRTYQRQGIGEMAVRTAVRATIWEVIWKLFR